MLKRAQSNARHRCSLQGVLSTGATETEQIEIQQQMKKINGDYMCLYMYMYIYKCIYTFHTTKQNEAQVFLNFSTYAGNRPL